MFDDQLSRLAFNRVFFFNASRRFSSVLSLGLLGFFNHARLAFLGRETAFLHSLFHHGLSGSLRFPDLLGRKCFSLAELMDE